MKPPTEKGTGGRYHKAAAQLTMPLYLFLVKGNLQNLLRKFREASEQKLLPE